jgi:hypothetical protein
MLGFNAYTSALRVAAGMKAGKVFWSFSWRASEADDHVARCELLKLPLLGCFHKLAGILRKTAGGRNISSAVAGGNQLEHV